MKVITFVLSSHSAVTLIFSTVFQRTVLKFAPLCDKHQIETSMLGKWRSACAQADLLDESANYYILPKGANSRIDLKNSLIFRNDFLAVYDGASNSSHLFGKHWWVSSTPFGFPFHLPVLY